MSTLRKVKLLCHLVELKLYIVATENWDFWVEGVYFTLTKLKITYHGKKINKKAVVCSVSVKL